MSDLYERKSALSLLAGWGVFLCLFLSFIAAPAAACTYITPGDLPCEINTSGDYCLTGSVAGFDPSAFGKDYAIKITCDNVELDGMGYTLGGVTDCYGLYVEHPSCGTLDNVTIRNVTASGWKGGIYVYRVSNAALEEITVTSCIDYGIYLKGSDGGSLSGILATGCGNGLQLDSCDNWNLSDINCNTNTGNGINIEASANNQFEEIATTDNGHDGIWLCDAGVTSLKTVLASGNTRFDVRHEPGSFGWVTFENLFVDPAAGAGFKVKYIGALNITGVDPVPAAPAGREYLDCSIIDLTRHAGAGVMLYMNYTEADAAVLIADGYTEEDIQMWYREEGPGWRAFDLGPTVVNADDNYCFGQLGDIPCSYFTLTRPPSPTPPPTTVPPTPDTSDDDYPHDLFQDGDGTMDYSSDDLVARDTTIIAEGDPAASLQIPALTSCSGCPEEITMTALDAGAVDPADYEESGLFIVGDHVYECTPAGTTFDPPIEMTIQLSDEEIAGMDPEDVTISWYDPDAGAWVEIATTFDPETNTFSASVSHFSLYALFSSAEGGLKTEQAETAMTPAATPAQTAAATRTSTLQVATPSPVPPLSNEGFVDIPYLAAFFVAIIASGVLAMTFVRTRRRE